MAGVLAVKERHEVCHALQDLEPMRSSLHPVPLHKLLHNVVFDHLQSAKAIACFASSTTHSSNLSATLLEDWDHKNTVISAGQALAPDSRAAEAPQAPTRCRQEGFCT